MTVKLFLAGDVIINKPNDKLTEEELKRRIQSADFALCNFEGSINKQENTEKKQIDDAILLLSRSGFTHIGLANNHINDFGSYGIEETLNEAKIQKIKTIGAGRDFEEAYSMVIEEKDRTKIGFLAFSDYNTFAFENTDNKSFISYINHPEVDKIILQNRRRVDILIVSIHGGITNSNVPLPVWRRRYQRISELGADIIIGHHSHSIQGWEMYNEKPIFYSLGDFYNDTKEQNSGYAVELEFDNKILAAIKTVPTAKHRNITIIEDNDEKRQEIKTLSKLLSESYLDEAQKTMETHFKNELLPKIQKQTLGFQATDNLLTRFVKSIKLAFKHQISPEFLETLTSDTNQYILRQAQEKGWTDQ